MTAAHAGWNSELVPVGGGGAVCERLVQAWRGQADRVRVTVLGSGPRAPEGARYVQVPTSEDRAPTSLSELEYARFCRQFEQGVTTWICEQPDPLVVFSHDISEGPDYARLARAGVPSVCLVHVDVVEIFTRLYLRSALAPATLTRMHAHVRRLRVVPDVLRLVFDKQADAVEHCSRLVVPSSGMREVLEGCYPSMPAERVEVLPWGAPSEKPDPAAVAAEREALAREWGLGEGERVIMTLSRLSPEKGQDRLLEAVGLGERRGEVGDDVRVVICGEAAFMLGRRFVERLKGMAARLHTRVLFPGHLSGARKRAALELATVFVSASRHESYGLTTMEAFAAGAPAVAVETHGSLATVDEACGLRVPAGPRLGERLWASVHRILGDPALRERLSRGAREWAERETFGVAAARLLELARELDGARG